MKIYMDLDDWKYYQEHPQEIIEDSKTIITKTNPWKIRNGTTKFY
jgi:hypothetical protein